MTSQENKECPFLRSLRIVKRETNLECLKNLSVEWLDSNSDFLGTAFTLPVRKRLVIKLEGLFALSDRQTSLFHLLFPEACELLFSSS